MDLSIHCSKKRPLIHQQILIKNNCNAKDAKIQAIITLKWKEKSKTKIEVTCKDPKGNKVKEEAIVGIG